MYMQLFIILFVLSIFHVGAQESSSSTFKYPNEIIVYDLPESSNGVKYRLYVRKPLIELNGDKKPTYFYFLDPLSLFVPASSMTANYEYFNYIPSAYFIGVGYQDEADGVPKKHNRTRDYTPTSFKPKDDKHFLSNSPADYEGSGGANEFIEVLKDEIIPFIEQRYGESEDRVLIGKSMSGLAAVHTLLTQPDLFNKYLIISSSLWWDDWFYDRSDRYVQKQIQSFNLAYPKETRVYLAVGSDEERFGLVTDHYVFANSLKNKRIKDLKVNLEVLDDEIHEGIFPGAFMRGILALYAEEEGMRKSATKMKWK